MKCNNCKLNPSCTMVWRISKKECPHFIRMTNADRIRAMSDEELAAEFTDHAYANAKWYGPDKKTYWSESCYALEAWIDWLRMPAEGEQHGKTD